LPAEQDDLLRFIARLAEVNDELLTHDPPPAEEFAYFDPVFMTSQRRDKLRARPNFERVECAITGNLEVDSSVFFDGRDFDEGAEQLGLSVIDARGSVAEESISTLNLLPRHSRRVVQINKASIYGINFKIFGVGYPWYPGEDRVSFIFLHCPKALFLDGRIIDVFHRTESPGLINFDFVQGVDWYARAPEVHLRYYLENWFDHFFSWVKFFFVPNFHWWRHDSLPSYDHYQKEFEKLQVKVGRSVAKSVIFDEILDAFVAEATLALDKSVRASFSRRKPSP